MVSAATWIAEEIARLRNAADLDEARARRSDDEAAEYRAIAKARREQAADLEALLRRAEA